jgi:MraZ protein
MFWGENPSTIDGKGRTSIPVKFRDVLVSVFGDERFVVTKATPVDLGDGTYGRGLSVYPLSEWNELERKINANEGGLPTSQLNILKRQILGAKEESSADKLGRVLLTPALRLHAGLEREILFVGMGNRFDVWSRETYRHVLEQDEKNFPVDNALGI